jgi:glutamate dehydrogenase (NADP+)
MVAEVSNMGCTPEAIAAFRKNGTVFAPGKAVDAGGVATSCLEMSQNAGHCNWAAEEVDKRLFAIMSGIHETCVKHGRKASGEIDYVAGANIAGFLRVANAMIAQGL